MNALTTIIPAFDAESPDAQILDAFEQVRALRCYSYGFDGTAADIRPDAELTANDDRMFESEKHVEDNVARTLPGVVARLMLLIPGLDNQRWVDRGLMGQGFLALYAEIENIDGHAQQVAYAAHEIIDIDWEEALSAYERSREDFSLALSLKNLVDRESIRLRGADIEAGDFLQAVGELSDKMEDHFSNDPQLRRLVRTLSPDHTAYLRKVEIVASENYQEDAFPWLARDTRYLAGRISDAKPLHGEA